ncbi:MAG TPA: carboxypeptidase regulatory-like domain-containing protein [Pyrinomonadaceae bacterium]|nr:carboxypeptidase regulatory-like domain-containing protein [Pyrinomonadaceae bacterium]
MSSLILFRRVSLIGTLLFTFTAALGQAQATKDASPPRTGSISGHVLIDNKAAANVEVGAFGGADSFNRRVAAAQVKTDSEGYYHVSGLPASNYQVTTFTPNMIPAENTPQSPLGYGYFVASKTVMLAAGEDVTEIDLKLARGGVITGRVTDAEDKPVVEEPISLTQVTEPGQNAQRLPSQGQLYRTDDRGVYRIYGLPPGRYRVSVGQNASSGIASVSGFYLLTYHPDATDVARATVIDLAAGAEAANVDIKVGRRGETHALTGRVVDAENGLPISGVRVGVEVVREGSMGYASSISTTTADGSFTIPGVTGGRYNVYLASENGGSDFYSDPVPVSVTDQDVGGIEVKALRGTSISGSIVPESMELKELLRQLPGLRVSANISPVDGRMTPTTIRSFGSAPVAADGSFTITGLRPGHASFSVSGRDPSMRPSLVKITVGGVGVIQGFEIERQPVSGVQLVVTYGTGVIRGSVTMQGGALTDFRTEVICRREGARTYQGGGAYMDVRGHFTIKGLAPGSYDCGVQLIPLPPIQGRPVSRPPQVPHQTVTVSNDVETEVTFLVDLTPKVVGP